MKETKSCEQIKREILDAEYNSHGFDLNAIIKDLVNDIALRIINDIKNMEQVREDYENKRGS